MPKLARQTVAPWQGQTLIEQVQVLKLRVDSASLLGSSMRAAQKRKLKKVRQTLNETQLSQMTEFDFLLSQGCRRSKQPFF
jgi:hypothetical protein